MKASFIILLLTTIGYISCLININDISPSTEFIVNTNEYPNNMLPVNSVFFFRMKVEDLNDKLIKLRTEEKDSFTVKIALFEEKENENEIEWDEPEPQENIYDFTYYIYLYHLKLKENTKYILISITLKKDLNYLSIYIKNDIEEKMISYKSKFFTNYQVNLEESQNENPKFIIELTEEHIGENFLNFIVKKNDTPVDFKIFGFGLKKTEEEYNNKKEKNIENMIDIKLNDTIINPENNIYKYKFNINDNSTNTFISVKLDKKIDFSFYVDYPEKEKVIPIYNFEYYKEKEIDVKNWAPSKKDYFIIKIRNKHIGETSIINLKVNKGMSVDNFYLIGYGTKENVVFNYENSEDLNVKYIKTISKGSYDIIQYYFEAKDNIPFFIIKVYIYKHIDYLSIEIGNKRTIKDIILMIICVIISIGLFIFTFCVLKAVAEGNYFNNLKKFNNK